MQAIRTEKVTKSFCKKEVLCGIDLSIDKGEIFGLLGPSGAGKTTLIKILTGQTESYGGSAVVLGKEANSMNGADHNRLGIMMDNFGVYERMSCRENLRLFAKIYGIPKSSADEALAEVGLESAAKTAAKDLSKGMRNRLQLADSGFFRINKSCLVRLKKIKSLKADIDRKIRITMENGEQLIASRMYADELRKKLGVK